MDELDRIAGRADAIEREFAQAAAAGAASEKPSESPTGKAAAVSGPGPKERAENMAESLLKVGEKITQAFVDQRLVADGQEVDDCRESVGPLLDKYNLVTDGDGRLPYQEEITAGFYLGGLWRRFRRALAQLRAGDRKKAQEREQARNHGDQRKHETQKQPHAVSSDKRVRQEPNAQAEGWNTERWG